MAKRHERTRARKSAIQVLYSSELSGDAPSKIIDSNLISSDIEKFSNYADALVRGVEQNREEIDSYILRASENWTIERMPVVDRCILRIAIYEMLFVEKVPVSVAINEAVDLAREFGGEDDSGRFVNGILGMVAKVHCETCEAYEIDEVGVVDEAEQGNQASETNEIDEANEADE